MSYSHPRRGARAGAMAVRGAEPARPQDPTTAPSPGRVRSLFVAAIGLSAFLLFTLELLAGRQVLPVFGGTPGVWTTALFFFSTILLAGYAYSHLLITRLGLRRGGAVHLVVAAVLVAVAVVSPAHVSDMRDSGLPEVFRVVGALLVLAGPPAFLLASTTPLLSAWFGGMSNDAWWLYAASNAASFAALLAYPALFEPLTAISTQRAGLLAGLVLFFLILIAVVAVTRRPSTFATPAAQPSEPIAYRRAAWWFAAAFVPAGLLAATTNFMTTDLVSAPLLWVGPLAVYLASFVVAFSVRGRRILRLVDAMVPAAATLLWLPYALPLDWPAVPMLLVELASFAVLAIAIHGRLALDRPANDHLTLFYLVVAAAGMAATAVVAVVAPLVFSGVYEYPLLLVLGLVVLALLRPPTNGWLPELGDRRAVVKALLVRVAPYLAGIALLVVFIGLPPGLIGALLLVGFITVVVVATPRLVAAGTATVLVASLVMLEAGSPGQVIFQGRSFFGVSRVFTSGGVNQLYSGTTLHGLQLSGDEANRATTYYAVTGPLGDVYADLRARTTGADVGAVGLGTGTVSAYSQYGDSLVFFEINPLVIRLAYDPAYFTFVRQAPIVPTTILGDGRLSLETQPPASFDLLVLDAFSSDAVPPHLLTREAIEVFMRTLRPGGILAFNVSNRYYTLAPAIGSTAKSLGLDALGRNYNPDDDAIDNFSATDSLWVVVGQPVDVARFRERQWLDVQDGPVLTDDYPDITRLLHWGV